MNHIEVVSVGTCLEDVTAWNDYIAIHPSASPYHHLAWRTIFENGFGYRSWMLMVRDARNGSVRGVLPLYLVQGLRSSRLVSVPFRDRGGPLCSDEAAMVSLVEAAKEIFRQAGSVAMIFKSIASWPDELTRSLCLEEKRHWIQSRVLLEGLTSAGLWKRIGPKTRNMVRQAESAGLTFDELTSAETALTSWYRLHLETQRRLGLPPFPEIFFATMFAELAKLGAISIYCVRNNLGSPIAATILLRQERIGIYAYSASLREAQQVRANDLMLFEIIRHLIEAGYSHFDMGSDAPNQDSLLFFKRKWGAVQDPIPTYVFGNPGQAIVDSSASTYALARKLFARLPRPVYVLAGRYLTKRFG